MKIVVVKFWECCRAARLLPPESPLWVPIEFLEHVTVTCQCPFSSGTLCIQCNKCTMIRTNRTIATLLLVGVFNAALWGKCYFPHFVGEETESQRVLCSPTARSGTWKWPDLFLKEAPKPRCYQTNLKLYLLLSFICYTYLCYN